MESQIQPMSRNLHLVRRSSLTLFILFILLLLTPGYALTADPPWDSGVHRPRDCDQPGKPWCAPHCNLDWLSFWIYPESRMAGCYAAGHENDSLLEYDTNVESCRQSGKRGQYAGYGSNL